MLLLDVTIVNVALPQIQAGLHTNFSGVQWVVDAYALTLASLLLTAGCLADRYGHRRVFVIGLAIFTGGSVLCGIAHATFMLIAARSVQGIGGAVLFATSLSLLAHTFHGKDRGVALGIWGAVTGIATALGPILGGVIISLMGWRGIFLINLPVGLLAVTITMRRVEEFRPPHPSRPDWAGFALLAAGLAALVFGLIRASEHTWGEAGVVISIGAGVVLLVLFVMAERTVSNPMLDLSLFRVPTFVGGSIAAFTMNGTLFAMLVYLVLYIQNDLGYSALATGERLLLVTCGTLVTATISGRLSSVVPVRWLIGPGLALVGVGLLCMSGLDAASSWTHLIPGLVLAGIGSGLVNPPLSAVAIGVVDPQRSGMASGSNNTARQIGIAVSIGIFGSLFAASLRRDLDRSLAAIPWPEGHGSALAAAVKQGEVHSLIADAPASLQSQLEGAVHASFAVAMNDLLLVSGVLALVGAVLATLLIRSQDLVTAHPELSAARLPLGGDPQISISTAAEQIVKQWPELLDGPSRGE